MSTIIKLIPTHGKKNYSPDDFSTKMGRFKPEE